MKVLQYLMDAVDLSVYSYIKPGAPHRYSLYDQDLHKYVKTITTSLNTYIQAVNLGESIAKGLLGIPSANLGKLISQAISASFSKLTSNTVVELHLMLVPTTVAVSHTLTNERVMNLNTFRKTITSIIAYSDVKDALEVYSVLKKLDRYERFMIELGISEGVIRTNSMNLRNVYLALSKKVTPLSTLADKLDVVVGMVSKFIKTYDEAYNYNLATVASYLYGLEALYGISFKSEILKERNVVNELYRLDRELRGKGYNFNELIPTLCVSTLLSLSSLDIAHS